MRAIFQKFGKHWKRREHSVVVSNGRSQRTFPHLERNQSDSHCHPSYLTSMLYHLKKWQLSHVFTHLIKYLLALTNYWVNQKIIHSTSVVSQMSPAAHICHLDHFCHLCHLYYLCHLWDLFHLCTTSDTWVTYFTCVLCDKMVFRWSRTRFATTKSLPLLRATGSLLPWWDETKYIDI